MENNQQSSSSSCNAPFKDNDFIHNIISFAQNYSDSGFSVLPTRKDKSPAIKWSELQQQRLNKNEIEKQFFQPEVRGVGIICGKISGNLEVIDIDCKNDSTGELWNNVFHLAKSSFPDLLDRLVIAKTVNSGYHLYYRCQTIERNQILSKNLKNEVLIETRSEGGYVIAAPSEGYEFIQGNVVSMPEITPIERLSLLSICKSFNESLSSLPDNKSAEKLSPFEDFNKRGDLIALLESHSWKIVSENGDYIYLSRPGKQMGHISASYNKKLRLFYPFTTSTVFDANRGYNAVQVYTIYVAGNDSSRASLQLYEAGFGDRREKPVSSPQPIIKAEIESLPIDGFPQLVQDFIKSCVDTYRTPQDFWAGAVMIATALAIGDKVELNTKYKNVPLLWMGIIGEVSSGKTEAMEFVLRPFADLDALSIQQWKKHYKEWEKEKGSDHGKIIRPEVFQYLLKDSTPEAMAKIHELNQRGILIYYDELKGWIDNFNRYNKNGEESFIVSAYTRSCMTLNRKSGGVDSIIHIPNPLILVLGSIQPGLLPTLAADNRQENGFLSRFCFIWPVQQNKPNYTKSIVPDKIIEFWKNFITNRLQIKDKQEITLSPEAELLYEQWFNKNCELSNKESSGYLKGVYGKLDIIALRVAIVLYGMSDTLLNRDRSITGEEMSAALKITEYFRSTALKVYRHLFKGENEIDKKSLIKHLSSKGHSQPEIAEIVGVSQPYVNRILKYSYK